MNKWQIQSWHLDILLAKHRFYKIWTVFREYVLDMYVFMEEVSEQVNVSAKL